MLTVVAWITPQERDRLRAGQPVAAPLPRQAEPIELFCDRHGLPWGPVTAALSVYAGPVPAAEVRSRAHRVQAILDVDWILQDLKVAGPAPLEDELLGLWAMEQHGLSVGGGLSRIRALTGLSPSARGDELRRMLRQGPVEARLLRGLSDDDVERYEGGGRLPQVLQ